MINWKRKEQLLTSNFFAARSLCRKGSDFVGKILWCVFGSREVRGDKRRNVVVCAAIHTGEDSYSFSDIPQII